MKTSTKGYIVALCQAVITGLSLMFIKVSLQGADVWDLLAFRYCIAFFCISIPVLIGKVKINLRLKDFKRLLPLCLIYPLSFFTLQSLGLLYSTSSEAGIIMSTVPILTTIFAAYILKERTSLLQKAFIALSVCSVVFISLMSGIQSTEFHLGGTLFTLAAMVMLALVNVLVRKASATYTPYSITFFMLGFGCIAFVLISVGSHLIQGSFQGYFAPFADTQFLWSVLYLGALVSFVAAVMANYMFSVLEAYKGSVFGSLATVISIFAGHLFLHEDIYWYHIVGTIVIIGCVFMVNYLGRKPIANP